MKSVAGTTHLQDCKLDETTYNGWSVYRLSNGLVNLYLVPQLGGRAIQIELGDVDPLSNLLHTREGAIRSL